MSKFTPLPSLSQPLGYGALPYLSQQPMALASHSHSTVIGPNHARPSRPKGSRPYINLKLITPSSQTWKPTEHSIPNPQPYSSQKPPVEDSMTAPLRIIKKRADGNITPTAVELQHPPVQSTSRSNPSVSSKSSTSTILLLDRGTFDSITPEEEMASSPGVLRRRAHVRRAHGEESGHRKTHRRIASAATPRDYSVTTFDLQDSPKSASFEQFPEHRPLRLLSPVITSLRQPLRSNTVDTNASSPSVYSQPSATAPDEDWDSFMDGLVSQYHDWDTGVHARQYHLKEDEKIGLMRAPTIEVTHLLKERRKRAGLSYDDQLHSAASTGSRYREFFGED